MSAKHQFEIREGTVPMGSMTISADAQRALKESRVDHLVKNFDITAVRHFVVNHRDGTYYILDGQHRFEAYKQTLGPGWERKHVKCHIYDNLNDSEMAEAFLRLNDTLNVSIFDKYEKGVTAKRDDEVAVDKIVRACGLVVREGKNHNGSLSCPGMLLQLYKNLGSKALRSALTAAYSVFDDLGLAAHVVEGLALVFHRYDKRLTEGAVIERFSTVKGGLGSIQTLANNIQVKLKKRKGQSMAAAMVEVLNKGATGAKRLPDWFSVE